MASFAMVFGGFIIDLLDLFLIYLELIAALKADDLLKKKLPTTKLLQGTKIDLNVSIL